MLTCKEADKRLCKIITLLVEWKNNPSNQLTLDEIFLLKSFCNNMKSFRNILQLKHCLFPALHSTIFNLLALHLYSFNNCFDELSESEGFKIILSKINCMANLVDCSQENQAIREPIIKINTKIHSYE